MLKMAGQKGNKMGTYKVGVGVGGCVLEFHRVKAQNKTEAYDIARRRFCPPDRGFDTIVVRREREQKGVQK